jgi:hypothetical protein
LRNNNNNNKKKMMMIQTTFMPRMMILMMLVVLLVVSLLSEQQQQRQQQRVSYSVNAFSFLSTTQHWQCRSVSSSSSSAASITTTSSTSTSTCSTTALFAKSRKARRQDETKKQGQGRSKQFYEALEQAGALDNINNINNNNKNNNNVNKDSSTATATATAVQEQEEADQQSQQDQQQSQQSQQKDQQQAARRNAIQQEAEQQYQQRPEVTTMVVDEETGTQVLAQGQKILDIVTRKAVQLPDTPEQRLAVMFPQPTDDDESSIRKKYRFDWRTITVPEMVEQWKHACYVTLPDGTRGVPPHPSVAQKAIDFVLANRDYMGPRMKKTLARWTMHHASNGDWEAAQEWKKIWDNYLVLENHISAPFRQIMQDAEGRVGPNFGNLDLQSFCNGHLYERIANYLVLKGMVAHWEKKVVDANFYENNPQPDNSDFMRWLATGDPKRYLTEPPILWTLTECAQVCGKAQEMCQLFVQQKDDLFADFPPEIVFLEQALKIKGGTALRKYMIDEFCPERGITPQVLRERMRRFHHQLDTMQIDPYADLTNKVELLYRAMAIGTDDERDPYEQYLGLPASTDPSNPAYFETYTFNHPKNSLIRFLDNQYPEREGFFEMVGPKPTKPEIDESTSSSSSTSADMNPFDNLSNLFGGGGGSGNDDGGGGGIAENPFENLLAGLTGTTSREKQLLRSEPNPDADKKPYDAPEIRRMGRRHELGWLTKLAELDNYKASFENVQPGRIFPNDEDDA